MWNNAAAELWRRTKQDIERHLIAAAVLRGWVIGWGTELDVRTIAMRGNGTVTDLAVASYLAKYATKGTETTGHASARITPDTIDLYDVMNRIFPRGAGPGA